MENNEQNDAFVFMDSTAKKVDSKYKPYYVFDQTSWEWLLERILRRKLILDFLRKDAGLCALTLHGKAYKLHPKLVDYTSQIKFDGNVIENGFFRYGTSRLPTGEMSIREEGDTDNSKVKIDISTDEYKTILDLNDIFEEMRKLVQCSDFLDPEWEGPTSPVTASITIDTSGKLNEEGEEEWENTITYSPFTLPKTPFFRLMTDFRPDDEPVKVSVKNSEGNNINVSLCKTRPAVKVPDDLVTRKGVKVLNMGYSGVNTLSILSFDEYADESKFPDKLKSSNVYSYGLYIETLGTLRGPIQRTKGSAIYTFLGSDTAKAKVQPNVSWGDNDEPTWWHAHSFPESMSLTLSETLRAQLRDLSITQPAVPPHLPYLQEFPTNDYNSLEDPKRTSKETSWYSMWPEKYLPLLVTPINISLMLDNLKTTVFEVPELFVKLDIAKANHDTINTTKFAKYKKDVLVQESSSTETTHTENTFHGIGNVHATDFFEMPTILTSSGFDLRYNYKFKLVPAGDETVKQENTSTYEDPTTDDAGNMITITTKSQDYRSCQMVWDSEITISDLYPLRRYANIYSKFSGKLTDLWRKETTYDNGEPSIEETSSEKGSLPEGDDLKPDASLLLIPPFLKDWIHSASLYVAFESTLDDYTPHNRKGTIDETKTYSKEDGWKYDTKKSLDGSGSSEKLAKKGVMKLGEIDIATGKLSSILTLKDIYKFIDPSHPNYGPETSVNLSSTEDDFCNLKISYFSEKSGEKLESGKIEINSEHTKEITEKTYPNRALFTRTSKLFVVIKWNFDSVTAKPFGYQLKSMLAVRETFSKYMAAKEKSDNMERKCKYFNDRVEKLEKLFEEAKAEFENAKTPEEKYEIAKKMAKITGMHNAAQEKYDEAINEKVNAESETGEAKAKYEEAQDTYAKDLSDYKGPVR